MIEGPQFPEPDPIPWLPPEPPAPGPIRQAVSRFLVAAANLAALLAFGVGASLVFAIAMRVLGIVQPKGTQLVIYSGAVLLATAGFTGCWTVWLGRSVGEGLGWTRNSVFRVHSLIVLGVLLAPIGLGVSLIFPGDEPPPIEKLASEAAVIPLLVLAVAVAPLTEETIFRGFLFRVFSDAIGAAGAVVATTAVFTLLHLSQLWGSWAAVGVILRSERFSASCASARGRSFPASSSTAATTRPCSSWAFSSMGLR
jgi:membrane protease YdiL (CAAX protease family)